MTALLMFLKPHGEHWSQKYCLVTRLKHVHRLMSATIRDNILFSHIYDPEFYDLVLDGKFPLSCTSGMRAHLEVPACALKQDISMLADGDLTQVGERGITVRTDIRFRVLQY